MHEQIIRQLGNIESLYDDEVLNGSLQLSRAFHTQVAVPIDTASIQRALSMWTQRHPFLRARIRRPCHYDSAHLVSGNKVAASTIRDIKYFAYTAESGSFANVEYAETSDELEWQRVIERELVRPFDAENGPLWRLTLLKLNNDLTSVYSYVFIFTNHHSIGDGRALITIMTELLKLVGMYVQAKSECTELSDRVEIEYPGKSIEHLVAEYLASHPGVIVDDTSSSATSLTAPSPAPLMLPCAYDETKMNWPEHVGDPNGSTTATCFDCLMLERDKLAKLIAKTKQHTQRGKMTGVLVTLLAACFKTLFRKYGESDANTDIIQYEVLVSLREQLGLRASQMGVYCTVMKCSIACASFEDVESENVGTGEALVTSNVWRGVDEQSSALHARLGRYEHFANANIDELVSAFEHERHFNSSSHLFAFSNVGAMVYDNGDERRPIKVSAHYVAMSVREARISGCFFIGTSTISDRLCMSFNFNERRFSRAFVAQLKQLVHAYVDRLIA